VKITFLPKSRLGKWSTWLNFIGLFLFILMATHQEILNAINSHLVIIFGITAIVLSTVPCVTGIIAVTKKKDRSILVFISILLSLITVAFLLRVRFGPD